MSSFGAVCTGALTASLLMAFALSPAPAQATGTVTIVRSGAADKTYTHASIIIHDETMWITSRDKQGTFAIGKAACMKVGELIRCYPYDATLEQYGKTTHIALTSGTVWFNPTKTAQPVAGSSKTLPPKGVSMVVRTKAGTAVSLTGIVDKVKK